MHSSNKDISAILLENKLKQIGRYKTFMLSQSWSMCPEHFAVKCFMTE